MTESVTDINKNLLDRANYLTDKEGLPLIPIYRDGKDSKGRDLKKTPPIKWTKRRDATPIPLATSDERLKWWSTDVYNIGVLLGRNQLSGDLDGAEIQRLFWKVILPLQRNESMVQKVRNTWWLHTPNRGQHFILNTDDSCKDIISRLPSSKKYGVLSNANDTYTHNEFELFAFGRYAIQGGFETENGTSSSRRYYQDITEPKIQTLNKQELDDFMTMLLQLKTLVETSIGISRLLTSFYHQNHRNNISWTLAGFLWKYGCPEWLVDEIIRRVHAYHNDTDPLDARLNNVRSTCTNDPNSADVNGYDKLFETLQEAYNSTDGHDRIMSAAAAIAEVSSFMEEAAQVFGFTWRRGFDSASASAQQQEQTASTSVDEELRGVPSYLLNQLTPHIYGVISTNPPIMYVAHRGMRKIVKAIIKWTNETSSTGNGGQRQVRRTPIRVLDWKYQLVSAVPANKVIINDSPIEEGRTYKVTFIDKYDKTFTIGPCSVNAMIEDLAAKGKVIKKAEAIDALTIVLERYGELGLAEMNETVTTFGFYYINGKFEMHDIRQIIDKEPDVSEMKECAEFLNTLSTKWRNENVFPTVVKWFTLSPFGYIFKQLDKWLPNTHAHGWSSTAKTTFGLIGLAIWRLNKNELKRDYQLGFANIDNVSRFGEVIRKSTYPKTVNEVGGLADKFNHNLVETIKQAIESPNIRGKFVENKYRFIPALSCMFFTSNSAPPNDSGYRSKTSLIHFTKHDVHERSSKEAKEFDTWIKANLHKLGVLGDFIVKYVVLDHMDKPEESILFSGKTPDEMSKEILTAFYNKIGVDVPAWINRVYEQRLISEEDTEKAAFEIRGFLLDRINTAYSRYYNTLYTDDGKPRTSDDPADVPNNSGIEVRVNHCLNNMTIGFIHERIRKDDNIQEIIITHDILSELTRSKGDIEGLNTLEDLGDMLPGFNNCVRKLAGTTKRVIAGSYRDFINFLESKVEEDTTTSK